MATGKSIALSSNVVDVLSEHGGVWISPNSRAGVFVGLGTDNAGDMGRIRAVYQMKISTYSYPTAFFSLLLFSWAVQKPVLPSCQ